MKKTTITLLMAAVLSIAGLKAQTLQEGINHLYADRFKSAIAVFEKLIATNPNNIEAIYWLGQTYFDDDNNAAARQLYEKTLQSNGNAPLILVGLGHADLLDKKTSDARQRFEAALVASRGRKGDDPAILYAIGRANVDAKAGDIAYAIEKLEAAAEKDKKNPEVFLQLGNAYRKARPGEGGGLAYTNYKKALELDPNFAVASLRLARLFQSQRNWELVLQYLNDAVREDPKFAPAYYELFYYYFLRQNYPEAERILNLYVACTDDPIANDYLYAQMCFGKKDFDCAISKATAVVTAMGTQTKPKVYRLLSYAYFEKSDYNNAQMYTNRFFARAKPDSIINLDYKLKADILSRIGGSIDSIYNSYIKGASLDTVLSSKIDFLKKGADYFKEKGDSLSRLKEGDLRVEIIKLKTDPGQRDIFDAGFAYYMAKDYLKSIEEFNLYTQKFPDETFGWEWLMNNFRAIDTAMEQGLAVPSATKLLEVSDKDREKNKRSFMSAAGYLATYYANVVKDRDKAIEYLKKMLEVDPENESLKSNLQILENATTPKQPANQKGNSTPKTGGPKPASNPK
ncbi:MAG: tetratricopeptide repeat protein [Bacteroidia bacterium]|nr:tetratricopeptide repeat protein [Bacteroidia bacterium]